jgi:nitrogen-specific signal transduction histidine kinase
MTLDSRSGVNGGPRIPALDMEGEYSKGAAAGESELCNALRACIALAGASDHAETVPLAMHVLTDASGLGYRRALLLRVEAAGRVLAGREVAGPRAAEWLEPLRAWRLPLDLADEHPLTRILAEPRTALVAVTLAAEDLPEPLRALATEGPLFAAALVAAGAPRGLLLLQESHDGGHAADALRPLLATWIALQLAAAWRSPAGARAVERGALVGAVAESAGALLRMTNLPDILVQTARAAVRATKASGALLWTLDEGAGELLLAVHAPARRRDSLEPWLLELAKPAQNCAQSGAVTQYGDLGAEAGCDLETLSGPLQAIYLPLAAFGDLLGVLAVLRPARPRRERPPFRAAEEGALTLLGGLAALAMKNAALADRAREAQTRLRDAQTTLTHVQRLATLGELVGSLANELRNPIIAIVGLARTIERDLPEGDPNREYARVILREARRMEERVAQQRACAAPAQPRLALQSLNRIVRGCVDALREETDRRGVLIEEIYSEQVPELLLDGERMHQGIGNILRRALEGLREGDTLRLETLRQAEHALIEIAHTGERMPGDVLEQLFVPFGAGQPAGGGLGLALAHQIVNEHGGEISVRCAGEWAAVYTLSLPLQANTERRRQTQRRSGRDRRERRADGGGR